MDKDLVRTLIVDDEPLARDSIRLLLQGRPGIEVVGECANGKQALETIRKLEPDLVFLDVQMPEMNGIEMLGQLEPAQVPAVIFVTAYDQYSLRAFEFHAIDYLLKPFDDERFEKALGHAMGMIRQRKAQELSRRLLELVDAYKGGKDEAQAAAAAAARTAPAPPAAPGEIGPANRLAIKSGDRVIFLRPDEIDWIEAADYYSKVHAGGGAHLLRESMSHLEARLDPQRFMRIHRSAIVNLDRVKELRQGAHGESVVVLHDGTRLKLSRGRKEKLSALLERSN